MSTPSTNHPHVTVYSTSWCPHCRRAKDLLQRKGVAFEERDVEKNDDWRDEMLARSGGRRTVPQIFIDGRHVGGADDLYALDARGELDALLPKATRA